jgi:hypothetical protein
MFMAVPPLPATYFDKQFGLAETRPSVTQAAGIRK